MKRERCSYRVLGLLLLTALVFPAAAQDFTRQTLSYLVPNAWDVATADFDNDGDLDVAVTGNINGSVWWVQNNMPAGMSTFPIAYIAGQGPRGADTGDFDGDGDADLVVACYGEDRFVWFENLGSGTSSRFREHLLRDSSNGAWSADAADVNGDGAPDLVVTEYLNHAVRILIKSDTVWLENSFPVSYPLEAIFADFDSDGDSDVVGGSSSAPVYWIENTSGGWLQHSLGFGSVAIRVVVADLDGDGDRDLAAALFDANRVVCWMRTATGFVADTIPWTIAVPRDLAAADFNEDGRSDLAVCSQEGTIAWFQQTAGGFAVHAMPYGASFRGMTVADFDRDGDPDIIAADYGSAELALYANQMGIPAVIEGTVSGAANGSPVPEARVSLPEIGASALTDAGGFFRLRVAQGTYTLTVQTPCWNEMSEPQLTLVMGDTITRNISLNRPLLNLGATSINVTTNNHVPIEVVLPLSNAGDGPLHVTVAVRGNSDNDPWLTIEPSAADLLPGEDAAFTVRIAPDTLDTDAWDYYGDITLRSNACPDTLRQIAVFAYVLDAPDRADNLPKRTALLPLYPNPFNGLARARLTLANDSDADLGIVDVLGRETMRVFHGRLNAGEHQFPVNANALASGVYLLVLRTGTETFTQKMLLIR